MYYYYNIVSNCYLSSSEPPLRNIENYQEITKEEFEEHMKEEETENV